MIRKLALALTLLGGLVAGTVPALAQSGNPSQSNQVAGEIIVSEYGKWAVTTLSPIAVGANNVQIAPCFIHVGTGNRQIFPFWAQGAQALNVPIQVQDGASSEAVASETAASFPSVAATTPSYPQPYFCSFTATFANSHAQGVTITSGDGGVAESMNDALSLGVGIVTIDSAASLPSAYPLGTLVYPSVQIIDKRGPQWQYWNPAPAAGLFAAPGALTSATAFSSLTVAGSASYTAATIHVAYTPVDCMGNEGPESADYSFTATATTAIQFTAPAAITGACGWIPYIGLMSGAATNEYQVKLYTQPTVVNVAPVSSGVCTLSPILLSIGKYACAITNASYGQTGSGAVVTAYPVVTSPQGVQLGLISTASYYQANSEARTAYTYAPAATPGIPGVVKVLPANTIATAAASTVPQPLGSVELPAGFMNYVGRSIEVCGYAYSSTQGASTVVQIAFEWDAQGSDVTTGLPVLIGGPSVTNTLTTGTTGQFDFCQDFTTTVASATATGGSIQAGHGYLAECALTTCATPAVGPNMTVAAVGSLNLAGPARLQVIMVQTTSSTAVPKLMNLSVKVLN